MTPPVHGQSKSVFTTSDVDTPVRGGPHDLLKQALEALDKIIKHTPGSVVPCNGYKCRESWCFSCNGEEGAEKALEQIYADCGAAVKTITAIRKELDTIPLATPEQEVDLNPETFLRLIETIKYMVGIAERGRGHKCPDNVPPEKFLLEYVIELEAPPPMQKPVAWIYGNGNLAPYNANLSEQQWNGAKPLYIHPAPIPPGMVLVPEEPTEKMLDALRADTTPRLDERYKAMLAAFVRG